MKIVLASSNAGKIREFKNIFSPYAIELIPQADLGIEDAPENAPTFIENALIKARHAAQESGLPALADDSGLAIAALHGAPGIYSARYAGIPSDHGKNIAKVLYELQHTSDDQRGAEFHCVLVLMSHAADPVPLVCEGRWAGTILHESRGHQGFGYDPIFYVPAEKKSAAELSPEIKNKMSHRGQALRQLIQLLPDKLHERPLC